ncbi:hypothetical protein PM082_006108 [Marasmius tenuissimus]|nr:hypothetical protein PM082_006108 [Marasmius tenuissimus]
MCDVFCPSLYPLKPRFWLPIPDSGALYFVGSSPIKSAMKPMKRRRQNGSGLSNRVGFYVTREDDEPLVEERRGLSYEEEWNEARAQLRRTFDMLTRRRPRLFNSSEDAGLFSDVPIYDPTAPDDDDWNDLEFQPAVGEEGLITSNAGGEFNYHTFLSSLLAEAPARTDLRDRQHRTEDRNQAWERQMPRLVEAYLKYQANGIPSDDECEGCEWKIRYLDFESLSYCPFPLLDD